jgi:membrane protein DedA with SNARE-associated domain
MIEFLRQGIPGYPGLFLACSASGIAFPVPEDVPLLYAGMQVERGQLSLVPTLVSAFPGLGVRDLLAYLAGRSLGALALDARWVRGLLGGRRVDRARSLVATHGVGAVLLGRVLVGMRAPLFFVAGAAGLPPGRFVFWDAVGLAVVIPVVVGLGHVLGAPFVDLAVTIVKATRGVVLGALVIALALLFVRGRLQRAPKHSVTLEGGERGP